jgi:large subunit ribosomal protein L25
MAVQSAQVSAKARKRTGLAGEQAAARRGIASRRRLRAQGGVVPVTLPRKEVVDHLNHGAHLFDLSLDGKSEKVLVKEVQYDHLGHGSAAR